MSFVFNKDPQITEYMIETEKLEEGEKVTFACIADLHECSFGSGNERLFKALDSISPDAILIPGDLIEASPKADPGDTMEFLFKLHGKYEDIFYSPGNHERKLFERIKYTKQMMRLQRGLEKAKVPLMRNTFSEKGKVRIYSLDLNHDYYRRIIKRTVPDGMIRCLLGEKNERTFNIMLAHDPDHFPEYVKWEPDLILSGHVHGGLIRLPKIGGLISPAYRFFPKYDCGVYEKNGVKMIVSRGAGSHTFNIRINNPPEILKIEIVGKRLPPLGEAD
ncbi:MAG: metallophosphoesterase [Lachnospiraceae bacterium]|nr:metallophosphoesterase [Lachnospiraceae bacterium]